MKVLFFGDVPHRLAGAQKSLLLSLSRIRQFGVEPIIAFPFEGVFEEACRKAGLDVRVLPSPPSMHAFGRRLLRISKAAQLSVVLHEFLPFARQLARLAEREGVGAMHFNTPRGLMTAGAAARMAGLGSAMHLRGVPALGAGYWLATQAMADTFILVARALVPYFSPSVQPKCRVVYNGVLTPDIVDRSAARGWLRSQLEKRDITLPDDALLFVSLSSPTPFKGLHHLLDAAELVKKRGLDAVFLCAGTGAGDRYETWLAEQVRARGLSDRFHLLGFWSEVHNLVSAADATILPSVEDEVLVIDGQPQRIRGTEGLPRTILESFAAGTPVIATRVAGVAEQVDEGISGLLVSPGDVAGLTDAIVDTAHRAEWRASAGRAGRAAVEERFTVDRAAEGLATVLLDLARTSIGSTERVKRVLSLVTDRLGSLGGRPTPGAA